MPRTPTSRFRAISLAEIGAAWWVPIGLAVAAADYLTGHRTVPPVFVPFVTAAGWYSGVRAGVPLALFLPMMRVLTADRIGTEVTPIRFTMGVLTLILLAVIGSRLGQHERDLQKRIRALESLLPMCMWCKGIRTSGQEWQPLETYMESAGTHVTHGICPDCARKHFPDGA